MKHRIAIFMLLAITLSAQNLDFFGYFESQFMGADIEDTFIQLQNNKLRLDLKADLSDQLTIAANYNWTTYHGKTEWYIPDYLPDNIREQSPSGVSELMTIPFSDKQELDNAYIKWRLSSFDLTLGKQQLSFGAGYAWNPTDLLNTKDLLDPTYEQPGHNAIRVDFPLANRINISAVYSPEDDWDNSIKMVNIKIGVSRFDVSLMAVERKWTYHNYTLYWQYGMKTPLARPVFDNRQLLGGSIVGQLFECGVWTEIGVNHLEITDDFTEWLVGFDYTFDFQTYIMTEFYQNTAGKTNSTNYDFSDWMAYLSAEKRSICKDQLYLLIQHPATDLLQVGLSSIISISDGSVVFLPTLSWVPLENMEILAYLNLYQGDKIDVFNSRLGNGGLIRARVYF